MTEHREPAVARGVLRYVLKEYFGVAFVYVLLAGVAGDWWWTEAWVVAALYFVWVTGTIAAVAPRSPELLAERAKRRQPGAESWDVVILALFGLETVARYVLAGLDARYGWTTGFPVALQGVGFVVAGAGFALVTWSMSANAWFLLVARIQEDRGQKVVRTGPYAWVRHPGYVGSCGMELGTALLLASWPAVVVGLSGCVLMVVRTALEDRLLQEKLDGYVDYVQSVRWRLMPGIW